MGMKLSFLSKFMPRNLDSSTTGIGDPYKCKTGHTVVCATDRNVHTVLYLENLKPLLVAQFSTLFKFCRS